jgi:hypothetical protein
VAFVADGEQIDMSDPHFWQKLLPADEAAADGAEAADGYGRGRRRHAGVEYLDESDDGGTGGPQGSRRDPCYAQLSSDEDEDEGWGGRGPSKPRRRRVYDSEGEDEATADGKLWPGAHAEGWRVHAKAMQHYVYVSPAVGTHCRPSSHPA